MSFGENFFSFFFWEGEGERDCSGFSDLVEFGIFRGIEKVFKIFFEVIRGIKIITRYKDFCY